MPQVVPRMFQGIERLLLLPLIAANCDPDCGMPSVRAYVHLCDFHGQKPRIGGFETDDLDEFLPDRLRDPQCATLIHSKGGPGARGWGPG